MSPSLGPDSEAAISNAPPTPVLILPGIGDSGPGHWQSIWQAANPNFHRVAQQDWDYPKCADWVQALEQAVAHFGSRSVLVAHSLGCLLVAHWALGTRHRIQGALLVAPPDTEAAVFPSAAATFSPVPLKPLPFPNIIVASSNDPYASISYSETLANAWGSHLVDIGVTGHINAASGFGEWDDGFLMLQKFMRRNTLHQQPVHKT